MVQHVSPSSVLLFLSNRADWYQKYVLYVRDHKTNPAALTGTAFHKYADLCLKGVDSSEAHRIAETVITNANEVDWGVTGSVEKCKEELTKLINHWTKEYSLPGSYLASEYQAKSKPRGIKIPIKGFVDAVVELRHVDKRKEVALIDWKTVKQYDETPKPSYLLAACMYKWMCEQAEDWTVDRFDFVQIKASENRDGSPQVRIISVYFSDIAEDEKAMKTLVNATIKEMNRKIPSTLPNLRDDYGAESSWNQFKQSLAK